MTTASKRELAAARQRRFRQRARELVVVVSVEVPMTTVDDFVECDRLAGWDEYNRAAIAAAAEGLLTDWSKHVTRYGSDPCRCDSNNPDSEDDE